MYQKYKNIKIDTHNITVIYQDDKIVSFTSIEPMVFKKDKEASFLGTNNDLCEITGNIMRITQTNAMYEIFFPNEVRFYVKKYIKKNGIFDLNYCKNLRNIYSVNQYGEVFLSMENLDVWVNEIENLRKKTSEFSTGVHNRPTLICYPQERQLVWAITKENHVVENGVLHKGEFE